LISYAVRLVRQTRPDENGSAEYIRDWVSWGAGPRASQYLILGAKARTILQGRYAVSIEDIQALAPSVLRHRIVPNFKGQGEGLTSVDIIQRLLSDIKPMTDGKAAR
jgi:MoxR-like ATPase